MTQSQIIKSILKDEPNKWFPSYELVKATTKYGWLGTSGDRRARELAERGEIEVRHSGKYAEFRAKTVYTPPPKVMPEYRVERVSRPLSLF